MKELMEDGALDPEKLFDEKKFNTIIVGKEGNVKQSADIEDAMLVLLSDQTTRDDKDNALRLLKDKKAAAALVTAIQNAEEPADKAKLIAACWETGLDFSAHYAFFAGLIASGDYAAGLEAYTVLETSESDPSKDILNKALEILQSAKDQNGLVKDAIALTQQKLQAP